MNIYISDPGMEPKQIPLESADKFMETLREKAPKDYTNAVCPTTRQRAWRPLGYSEDWQEGSFMDNLERVARERGFEGKFDFARGALRRMADDEGMSLEAIADHLIEGVNSL